MSKPGFDARTKTYTDKAGLSKSDRETAELAEENIRGSMSYGELLESYMDNLHPEELLEWATDEDGEF
jgi:hypothetical protein